MSNVTQSPPVAAIYVRVSSTRQEVEGTSLGTQEAACRAHAAERGYTVGAVYRETHTGADLFERPRLSELRETVRRGETGVVVAYALDRLTRDQAHLGFLLSECDHAGAMIELVTERLEDTAEGRLLQSVRGFVAEVERLKFRERSTRGRRARAEAGKPIPGWKAPYGYRWIDADKTRLAVDADEATVVRRLFQAAADGTPIRRIAIELAADGIPSPTGRPCWPQSTIHSILKSPTYTGEPRAFRMRVEKVRGRGSIFTPRPEAEQVALAAGVAPALVTRATQEAVLARLVRNKAEATRRNADPEATLLRSGFALCGYCGHLLRAMYSQQGWVYRCRSAERNGSCPGFQIQASILDTAVWERVAAVLTQPDIIAAEVARQQTVSPTADDRLALDRRLAEIDTRRQRAARAVLTLDDEEAAAPLIAEMATLVRQRRALEAERAALVARHEGWEADRDRLTDLAAWCTRVAGALPTLPYAAKRDALAALGVHAHVWRVNAPKRWEITMRIDGIVSATTSSMPRHWRTRRS